MVGRCDDGFAAGTVNVNQDVRVFSGTVGLKLGEVLAILPSGYSHTMWTALEDAYAISADVLNRGRLGP